VSGRKQVVVLRAYKSDADECARALKLLLKAAFSSQAMKERRPHGLTTKVATQAEGANQGKEGNDSSVCC
jgi:hypothetical protein